LSVNVTDYVARFLINNLKIKLMKSKKKISALLAIAFITLSSFSLSVTDIIDNISTAIRAGNAKELAKFFNTNIDVTIPGYEGVYSKTQAEQIIKGFFTTHPPKSFSIIHQGASKDGSQYSIGNYASDKKSFRSYFLLKKTNEQFLLHQLRFEPED